MQVKIKNSVLNSIYCTANNKRQQKYKNNSLQVFNVKILILTNKKITKLSYI